MFNVETIHYDAADTNEQAFHLAIPPPLLVKRNETANGTLRDAVHRLYRRYLFFQNVNMFSRADIILREIFTLLGCYTA
jgi:hypothetical protein